MAARFASFAALGSLSATQEMMMAALEQAPGADPELLAEETLCLVSAAATRAAELCLVAHPEAAPGVLAALADLPFTYRDYIVGAAMIEEGAEAPPGAAAYERLERKRAFYLAQLPPASFPGETLLREKMLFWMTRLSPPRLPGAPEDRLERSGAVGMLLTHVRLVFAFGRQWPGAAV